MSVPISPVTNNQVFGTWLARTNQISAVISANVVTTDNTALGGFTSGNGTVNGYFNANTLIARDSLRGGNVTASNTLLVTSNAIFQYGVSNVLYLTSNTLSTNVFANVTTITLKSSTNTSVLSNNLIVNTSFDSTINSNNVYVNSNIYAVGNVYLNSTSSYTMLRLNSTACTAIINGASFTVNSNTYLNGAWANVTANLYVGNYANIVGSANVGGTFGVTGAANVISTLGVGGLISGFGGSTITGTANASVAINVGANVNVNTSTIQIGNDVVNSVSNSTNIKLANNTSNLIITPVSVFVGNSVSNLVSNSISITLANTTANLIITPVSVFVGNSVSNLAANSINLIVSNTISTSILTPATLVIGNGATTQTTSIISLANSTGNVQITPGTTSILATGLVNAAAFTTTGNANASIFYAGANTLLSNTNLLWTGNTTNSPTISLSNTGALLIGNGAATANATTIKVNLANSSGNIVLTTISIQLSNATSNVFVANVTSVNVVTNAYFSNTVTMAGSWANVTGALAVQSTSQFNDLVTVSNSTDRKGMTVYGTLLANNDLQVKGNLSVTGALTYNGTGTASIIPNAVNYDLGIATPTGSSYRWQGVYGLTGNFSSNVVTANLYVTQLSSFTNTATFSNTTIMNGMLTANAGIKFIDGTVINSLSNTTSGTSTQTIDSFDITVYRSAEYSVTIKDTTNGGSSYQISKLIVVHDGVTSYLTEYAVVATNINPMGLFTADISGSNMNLKFQPNVNITSASLKIARISMAV
jgi:hypothetical protein